MILVSTLRRNLEKKSDSCVDAINIDQNLLSIFVLFSIGERVLTYEPN